MDYWRCHWAALEFVKLFRKAALNMNIPQAIGPYSIARKSGNFLFCSGQIPLDPDSMQLVGASATEQAHQVLKNIEAVLKTHQATLRQVIKTTIFLKNMGDFSAVNEAYGQYFQEPFPARSTVEVAALPKGALVEIEVIADLAS